MLFFLANDESVSPPEKGLLLLLLLRKPLSRLLAAPKFIRQRAKLELTMDGTRTETANNSRAAGVVLEFEMSTRRMESDSERGTPYMLSAWKVSKVKSIGIADTYWVHLFNHVLATASAASA